jgi:hypothetical protein
MKTTSILQKIAIGLLFLMASCENDPEEKTYSVQGYAQKGPFIVGSAVTVSELNSRLIPTGRVYFSTILNEEGFFELPSILLSSPYVQIKVEGKYFGEATGGVQDDELILFSVADLNVSQDINVNIITHLIKRRIEELVQQNDKSFGVAKGQAFNELLDTFNWSDLSVNDAEELNIIDENISGAVLLATSVIFDNMMDPTARLKAITDFQTDLKDGTINSEPLKSILITSAESVNRSTVQANLEYFYGTEQLPDFSEPLDDFIQNTEFVSYLNLIFPLSYNNEPNLVRSTNFQLNTVNTYYISITIPEGVQSDVLLYMLSISPSENTRFNAPSPEWDNLYFQGGSPCSDNENETNFNCFQSYAMIHRVNLSQNINIQIPVTFSGSGSMILYYSAQVNGTSAYKEVEFTW